MHAILKNQLGEKTSQEAFQKVFKPVTTKLDDVALGNLKLPALQRKRGIQAGGDEDIQPQIMH